MPAWIGPAISAAGAVAGAFGGGGGQEKIQSMEAIPRALRPDYLNIAGGVADLQTPRYWPGNPVAPINPKLSNALGSAYRWGQSGPGADIFNAMYQGGNASLTGGVEGGLQSLEALASGPGFQYNQGVFDQTMQNLQPGLQGAYDAAMRDPIRQFSEQTIPGINMGAAGTGTGMGTRAYNQGAIAQRGLQDRAADTASGLWQNAANQAQAAAMNAGTQNFQMLQNLPGQYGQFARLGAGMMDQANTIGTGNIGMQMDVGNYLRDFKQQNVDAAMDRWNFNQQAPWLATEAKLNMLPSPGGMSPGVPGANPFQTAYQGMRAGTGIYEAGKDAGWWGNGSSTPGGGGYDPYGPGGWDGSGYGYF